MQPAISRREIFFDTEIKICLITIFLSSCSASRIAHFLFSIALLHPWPLRPSLPPARLAPPRPAEHVAGRHGRHPLPLRGQVHRSTRLITSSTRGPPVPYVKHMFSTQPHCPTLITLPAGGGARSNRLPAAGATLYFFAPLPRTPRRATPSLPSAFFPFGYKLLFLQLGTLIATPGDPPPSRTPAKPSQADSRRRGGRAWG